MKRALLPALMIAAALVQAAAAESPGAQPYEGREDSLPVRFSGPAGWHMEESRGTIDAYHQVRFTGPRNKANTYTPYIVVRAFPFDAPHDIESQVKTFMANWAASLPDEAMLGARRSLMVGGLQAEQFDAFMQVPALEHLAGHPESTPVRTHAVIQARPPLLFEIIYSADERDYTTHLKLFEGLLDSLQFVE